MEQSDIKKGSLFISHFEAIRKIPDPAEQAAMYDAIFCYQFYGTMPENLPPIADLLMTGIFPVIEKEVSSKGGGRIEKVAVEVVAEKVKELGSKKAAAEYFGVTERTIYNKLSEIEKTAPEISCEVQCNFTEIEKTKEECRKKNEEGVNEEREKDKQEEKQGVGQCPPMELQAAPAPLPPEALSENSIRFPSEQIVQNTQGEADSERQAKKPKPFVPPTVEEVAEYCESRENGVDAEAFVAFYASKGWFVGKNKMKDWRQAVITWEKRNQKQPPYQARGSPAGAAASCDREWNSGRQIF